MKRISLLFIFTGFISAFAGANDASGQGNHAAFNNATLTSDRHGNKNSAYHFNGKNSYIRTPNSRSLNMDNKISLCAWIKPMGFLPAVATITQSS
jgi:hypothetical protein